MRENFHSIKLNRNSFLIAVGRVCQSLVENSLDFNAWSGDKDFIRMFKNWLTSEIANKSRDETHSASPDIMIEVGSSSLARFPAHSSILSQNSTLR